MHGYSVKHNIQIMKALWSLKYMLYTRYIIPFGKQIRRISASVHMEIWGKLTIIILSYVITLKYLDYLINISKSGT